VDILFTKKFEDEVNSPMRSGLERQPTRTRPNMYANEISKFFFIKDPFKKDDV
jgi:hypothetical protein